MGLVTETVSKNKYKKISKEGNKTLIGKTITFKLLDFVEKFPNDTNCKDWHIMGETHEVEFPHIIHGQISGVEKQDLWEVYLDLLWKGEITGMDYDTKNKQVNMYIKNAQMIFITATELH